MANETQQTYKQSFSGSVGAGMKSLFGAEGRTYYILEHKVSSKYHKVGEAQRIIVDQIEIGRDPKCQVRYDESFSTVSRRHAAIVRDGDNWKLIQLSQTNPTFLNGRKVQSEWYLQNGDEIQLSTNGPKLGFIVPTGDKSMVKSIGLTARLNLFRQQALRPYKTAIAILTAVLVIAVGGLVTWNLLQAQKYEQMISKNKEELRYSLKKQHEQDSIANAKERRRFAELIPPQIENYINGVEPSVYYVVAEVYMIDEEGESDELLETFTGTGFLLKDGRFVTTRHMVEPWMYNILMATVASTYPDEFKFYSKVYAINKEGQQFEFKDDDFIIDRSKDKKYILAKYYDDIDEYDENGNLISAKLAFSIDGKNANMFSTDWAYIKVDKKGTIEANNEMSYKLPKGKDLHVMGFPQDLGVTIEKRKIVNKSEKSVKISPMYNRLATAENGLDNSGCITTTAGIDHGNSGGPVMAFDGKKLYVVGVVSRFDERSKEYCHIVPIGNLKKENKDIIEENKE